MSQGWGVSSQPPPPQTHCTSGGLAAARLLGTSPCQPLLAQLLARPADSHGHLLTPTHELALALRALPAFRASRGPSPALWSPHPSPRLPAARPLALACPEPRVLAPYPHNLGSWVPGPWG